MPVDQYIGGIEHAILHLLYARFYTKVLRDLGMIGQDEPFTNLLTQGMVKKETVHCPTHGWLFPQQEKDTTCQLCGSPVTIGRKEKMSKSRKNVVDPDELIETYGADTIRLFCLFAAPPERDLDWSEEGVQGSFRFLARVWRMVHSHLDSIRGAETRSEYDALSNFLKSLRRKTHQTISRVTEDIEERFHFNTAISAIMELVNAIYLLDQDDGAEPQRNAVLGEAIETVVVLLSPIAPHICEELWLTLGHDVSLLNTPWPQYDQEAASEEEMVIVVQVNGKLRSKITVPVSMPEEEIKRLAQQDERTQQWIEGKDLKKIIYVPRKLVNLVAV
jgi:leucyl-tRNA synthetase